MRELKEIEKIKGLKILEFNPEQGLFAKYVELCLDSKIDFGKSFTIAFTWDKGWEHLSVSTPTRTPSWDEMCKFKEMFFRDDEACVEYHPKKEDYVNLHKHCLHIWKPLEQELPIPNKGLVY